MKLVDVAKKNGIEPRALLDFVKLNNMPYKETFTGFVIDDDKVEMIVNAYRQGAAQAAAEAKAEAEAEAAESAIKRKALSEMLITSGFNFEGYKITKYSGYISGDDAVSVNRGLVVFSSGVNVKDKLMESLVTIRRNALRELKEAAYALGCNAVIGVDFDYLTLDPQTASLGGGTVYQPYVFGVTANGNAVVIEKIED